MESWELQALEKRCLLSAVAGAVYPSPLNTATQQLEVSPNGRSLSFANGSPFFYLADTAWELFNRPTLAQADLYLTNRAAKGFTVIQANLLDNRVGDPSPIVGNDPTKINAAYFTNVDNILNEAQSLGLYVAIVPVWSSEVDVANSIFNAANAFSFGQYLGNRYKNRNVIWLLGGDSPNSNTAVWSAMTNGLIAGDGGTELMSFHPIGGDSSSQWYQSDSRFNFNMLQSGHSSATANYNMIANDYGMSPIKPTVDGESNYENIPDGLESWNSPITPYDVRLKTYWGIFAGGMGAAYGEMDIYQFWTLGLKPDFPNNTSTGVNNVAWQNVLNTPGADQMQYVAALMESRPLLNRIPDQSLIVGSTLTADDHLQATRDSGGAYAMIYSGSGQSFTVDMTKISGSTATAWWYNPRTGVATHIGSFATTGMQQFAPPTNGSGNDWVLVLDDASKGYAAPGQPLSTTVTAAQLAFVPQPSGATAGHALPAVTLDVEDGNGNLVGTDNSMVTMSVATGPGALSGTVVAQASGGVATFGNLILSTAGTYTLIATDNAFTKISNAVVISPTTGGSHDTKPPVAVASYGKTVTTKSPAGYYKFSITFTDNVSVLLSTITGRPIYVSGPNGYFVYARPTSLSPDANGTPIVGGYRIYPPDVTWTSADDGTYKIWLRKNRVTDTSGNFTPGELLGTFTVNIPAGAKPAALRKESEPATATPFATQPLTASQDPALVWLADLGSVFT